MAQEEKKAALKKQLVLTVKTLESKAAPCDATTEDCTILCGSKRGMHSAVASIAYF